MRKYRLRIAGKEMEVILTGMDASKATVNVGSNTYEVEIESGAPAAVRSVRVSPPPPVPRAAIPTGANGEIRAPMPGLILKVMVRPGDYVEAKQPVLKMETMKMENEIRSPRAGVVKDVLVSADQEVDQGQVLVRLRD